VTVRRALHRSTFDAVSSLAAARPARARLGQWPYDGDVAHLVLLDHHMVPTGADIAGWIDEANQRGARAVRTGALFPNATGAFLDAGFQVADTLALLARAVGHHDAARFPTRPRTNDQIRVRRLRPAMLAEASGIDRRAFSSPWANDTAALGDIMTATPYHRSRSVHADGRMVAFSISGRADRSGYIQRLAVDPSARRRGFARLLLDDALRWMHRRDVERAMVNTAADNRQALALYASVGFESQPGSLLILERPLR
jgi:ribosomal protein S18 acetylase RimI-like enzyme